MISFGRVSTPSSRVFWLDGSEVGTLRSRLGVSIIDAVIDAGLGGAGISTPSHQVAKPMRYNLQLLVVDHEPPGPIHLIDDQQNRPPVERRAFVDFVIQRLRDRQSAAAV